MNQDKENPLPSRIQYLLDHSDLNQSEVAQRLGVDKSAFSRIVSGNRKVSADELSKLADIFEVTTDFILGRNVDLGNIPVAAHFRNGLTLDDLPEDRRKAVLDYMEYQKSLYKKEMDEKKKEKRD